MKDNTKLNTFLCAIIIALCGIIGVLCYFVFGDGIRFKETEVRTRDVVEKPVEHEVPTKPKVKKTAKVDDAKPIYVMGEDGEAARRNYTTGVSIESEAKSDSTSDKGRKVLFIGNSRSGVYHYPNCSGVAKMAEYNKVPLYSREEAESGGFTLHKGCPRSF